MSAIFGIIDFEGRPIEREWIVSMQKDLAHRGPDRQGLYQEESMFFGHMLLQITPESVYDTSPYDEDGFVIAAYARLDEREAIMDRLNIPEIERKKITDPILLLRSFRKFGKAFLKDIYGDFAFAIWDKDRKELFCARDQIGVKPFLYYFEDNRFIFSTELKALVNLKITKTSINQKYFENLSYFLNNDIGLTAWNNIKRIKPAYYLVIDGLRLKILQYWHPSYKRNREYEDVNKTKKMLLSVLKKAVIDRSRVITDIGITLSGGLDSSTIATIAARELASKKKKLISVSSILGEGFEEEEYGEESEYIQAILDQEKNIKSIFVSNNKLKFNDDMDTEFDRHYATCNLHFALDKAIYEEFKSANVRRVLTGYLGDSTISNWELKPLPHLLLNGNLSAFQKLFYQLKAESKNSFFKVLKSELLIDLVPPFILRLWRNRKGESPETSYDEWPLDDIDQKLKKKSASSFTYKADFFHFTNEIWSTKWDPFEEDWDCGSSHHQVELTHPLADRRLIEFLLQMPIEHFNMDGKKRGLIRMVMKDYLPELVSARTTKGPYSPGQFQIFQKDIPKLKELFSNDKAIKLMGCPINARKLNTILSLLETENGMKLFFVKFWPVLHWVSINKFYIWLHNNNNNKS